MTIRILACQMSIPPMTEAAERDAHLAGMAERIGAELERRPADLVVLPELSSIDYSRAAFDHLDRLAEPLDGPSFRCWSEIARRHRCAVVYGFARRGAAGFYISMGIAGADGSRLGCYDKIHLAQYGMSSEKEYFTPGTETFTFEVKGFRIAPIICYDIRIPELSRILTLEGEIDLILHCGAYYRDESFATWHAFVVTRAIENQIFLLSLNRAGSSYGCSCMAYPWMDETRPKLDFDPVAEEFRHIRLDRDELVAARANYSFLKDRRQRYAVLSEATNA